MKLYREEAVDYQKSKLLGDVILHTPLSVPIIIFSLLLLLALIFAFVFTHEYKSKEKVSGYLMPKGGLTTIIAEESSVLQKFYVEVGDKVKKDQNLILLGTEKSLSNGQVVSEEITNSLDREIEKIDQRVINETEMQGLRARLADAAIKKLETDINLLLKEREILFRAKDIKNSQLTTVDDMVKKGYSTKRDSNEQELTLLDYKQRYNNVEMGIVAKKQELVDTKNRASLDALNLIATRSELEQRKEQIFQQKINLSIQEGHTIRAPIDGVVTSVFETLGSSLQAGKPILTIQPNDSELIARLAVPSRSIGLISDQQEVSLYYEAFPYQRFGVFKGMIANISLNVINPRQFIGPIEMMESFYFVDVKINKNTVYAYGKEIPLLAGMKLDAEVVLEKNTLYEWLISPIRAISRKYE